MIRFQSYRSKLQAAFLALSLAAIAVTEWQATAGASAALRQATDERLAAIRQTRARQIERYFEDVRKHTLALASDESTIAALEDFEKSWARIPEPRAETLQSRIRSSAGPRDLVLTLEGVGPYGDVHARFHPTLHRYQSAFGFYDILLIGARERRVLYTVAKESDLGTVLESSPLARVVDQALALEDPDQVATADYAPYAPSNFVPAAFVAAPVLRAGARIGAIAIQISVSELNRVMTGERRWREEGLGRSGQSYIVGPDGTLRTDLRLEIEDPAAFLRALRQAGIDPETVQRIERNRTSILNLRPTAGVEMLRSQAPLAIPGLNWTVVAEIEASEALAPVRDLRWRVIGAGLLVAAAFFFAAQWLARSVTRPVLALAARAAELGRGDFRTRIPVESPDELGVLAAAFNRTAEDLRTLSALINAVIVIEIDVKTPQNASKTRIRNANPAAFDLLRNSDLAGRALEEFLPGDLIDQLLRNGRLPAIQTSLLHSGIPVLFTAVLLPGNPLAAVCAAQDLSEWKAAQDQLKRMSQVFMEVGDPIVVCARDGTIVDANAEAERVYDWRRDELIGKSLRVLAPEGWNKLIENCLKGASLRNVETVLVSRQNRRIPVLATVSLVGGDQPGIAVIAKDITERKEAERALRLKQQELEALAARLITAQEDERSRLARELHDDFTQRLAVVAIEAGTLKGPDADWPRRLEHIKEEMARLSEDVHRLSRSLHPSLLNDLGLAAAIEWEGRSHFERGGALVEFTAEGNLDSLARSVQVAVFRIVQEALRNVQKHSGAEEVRIALRRAGSMLELEVEDNGKGFDRGPEWRPGVGLASMEERARLLGGTFRVESRPGAGTRIRVQVPVGDDHEKTADTAGR